jgi:hypothetical protein
MGRDAAHANTSKVAVHALAPLTFTFERRSSMVSVVAVDALAPLAFTFERRSGMAQSSR